MPLFVRWPGRLGPPREIPQIAAVIDLYPTLLDLCGVPPPPGRCPSATRNTIR